MENTETKPAPVRAPYILTDAERAYVGGIAQQLSMDQAKFVSVLDLIHHQQGLTGMYELSNDGTQLVPKG